MILDMTAIGVLLSLALNSINLIAQLRTILSSGEKKLDERLKAVEHKQLTDAERIQVVEAEIKHMPDRESVQQLQINVAEMKVQLSVMIKSAEATERATRRVEEFLMKKGADK
jgi:hypothetical protein